jgi:anti-sigma regulatory factor (Ser/Thr protein kinase)
MPPEKVRLRIRNLAKAVLVSGQAYQDPKDALNEFVSNAADEYAEADRTGERIRVVLRRKGRYPAIIIDDVGRGMSRDRLREVARSLFESTKAGDSKTLGEKAIGMLAFQQLGQRCDVVSRTADSSETWTLRLERGKATAILEQERRRMRQVPGTSVYLSDLDPDVLRVLTQRKVVDYLRSRRGPGLARGDYEIEVIEGSSSEIVLPERPDGVRLTIPARNTLWGRVEFAIYVAPSDGKRRRVAVVGRAGTSVVDDLTELDEFDCAPWNSDQVSGQVIFESLQQSAGRRAILRDREAFPLFVEAVKAIEPAVSRTVERVSKDVDAQTADRLSDQIRRIFGRVLKELSDMDNPMISAGGAVPGEGGVLEGDTASANGAHGEPPGQPPHGIDDILLSPDSPVPRERNFEGARPDSRGSSRLPTVLPDPNPREARSRFDDDQGIVFFNEVHADYLMVKGSESALLDYLATLVAKEYVVYNNPRASSDELGEELVRMLVRVRRHIPRRSDSKSG